MAKKPFFPEDFPNQIIWIINFDNNIGTYAAKYGITAAQLAAIHADREWMIYWWEFHLQMQNFAQGATAFKNEVAFGVPDGSLPSVPPVVPTFDPPPTAVLPGVYNRLLSIGNGVKVHKDYTVADGEVLRLEGAVITPPDLGTLRPVLKLTAAADHVDVGWKKQGTDGVEIWVKRGAAASVYLATDTTTPKYVDTHPFPATEEEWTYKAIYIFGGGRVGLWSEEVKVRVKA